MKLKNFALSFLLVLCIVAFVQAMPPDQPNMESAKMNLQNAKANLLMAEHNKGGHRTKAINFINQAISQVNKGINFARRHNHVAYAAPLPDQPHMEAALKYLQNAKSDLEKATPDKGGFRGNAIRLVNAAIDEVQLGIAAGRS
jgi:hypothetical protein